MEEITVILNGYKRPEYLEEQVQAIRSQTIPPKEIWLWINKTGGFADLFLGNKSKVDVVVESSRNFKYHGRFTLGLLARTEYVAFFDDDTIPGRKWFQNCLETEDNLASIGVKNPILGGAGVLLHNKNYVEHTRLGWPNPLVSKQEADLVGHAWFMPKEVLKYLWYEEPISLDNGEDIQLSFLAQKYGGIRTFCPNHPSDKNYWSSIKAWEYGNDKKASSNGSLMTIPDFYKQRNDIIEEAIKRGWKPMFERYKNDKWFRQAMGWDPQ